MSDIKVLTLNMWGVPIASKKVKERSQALVEHLLTSDYDVVGLQEVFLEWHAKYFIDGVQEVFGYSHWFRSGALGSPGLLVLSRHPILEVMFHPFNLNGYPQHVHRGDWWAGKGVGLCRIAHPLTTIDFYCTHLHAAYSKGHDMYKGHRINQMFNMAKFINQSKEFPVISLGDFNSEDTDLATSVFLELSGLSDSYRDMYPDKESHPGYTNDTPECNWDGVTPAMCSNDKRKRIDYIFYDSSKLLCKNSENVLAKIPDQSYSYSDHIGVVSTFGVQSFTDKSPSSDQCLTKQTSEAALQCLESSLRATRSDKHQKLFLWVVMVFVWGCVIALGFGGYLSAGVTGILASIIAAIATAVFWYLIIFVNVEDSKFSQAVGEMVLSLRYSR